jgi:hypothetical protein
LTGFEDGPVIRRLQRRWQRDGQTFIDAHVAGLKTIRRALEERSLEESAPEIYRQVKEFMNSPGGIELVAPYEVLPGARHTFDFFPIWRLRELNVPHGALRAEQEFKAVGERWGRFGSPPDSAFLRRFAELCLEQADEADRSSKVHAEGKTEACAPAAHHGEGRP